MSSPISPSGSSPTPSTSTSSPSRKRPHSESPENTSTSPKKKKQKTRYLESAATTSQVASQTLSSSRTTPEPVMKKSRKVPMCVRKKLLLKHSMTTGSTHPQRHACRSIWNGILVSKLQKEIYLAQQNIDEIDLKVLQLFASTYGQEVQAEPVLYIKRNALHANRLDWNKLKNAIQRLEKQTSLQITALQKIGAADSINIVKILKNLYNQPGQKRKRTPTFTNGALFTRQCALALAAQNIWVKPTIPCEDIVAKTSFISGTDVRVTEQDPKITFNNQWAVSLLQHKGTNILRPEEEGPEDNGE